MIKVVNPLVRKADNSDSAYGCTCYCNKPSDNHDDADSWTWLPWEPCGCACSSSIDNKNANHDLGDES
jgi:hypothetical protein